MKIALAFLAVASAGVLGAAPDLMPLPAHYTAGQGKLKVDENFHIAFDGYTEPRLQAAARRALDILSRQTGIQFKGQTGAKLTIHCDHASAPVQKLGEDESYRLVVDAGNARLSAPTPLGALRGLETFLQLLQREPKGFAMEAMTIDDAPRFPWRGLLLDVSRHWMPMEVVKRNLDGIAAVKLNVLHWHLTDDQGFRIESKKFPKLQQDGSDGLFYTQDQVREVIAYARERGIRVVPEFDMPGHTTSWVVGYPELASGPGPFAIERHWGGFDPTLEPSLDSTYTFLDGFIGEMAALFPDEYFHIGGDEVNGRQWKSNAHLRDFMQAHSLKTMDDLQSYFNERLQKIVAKHGKRMEGWDEILHAALPKNVVVQTWRNQKSLAEAAQRGFDGMLSAGYYLDLAQPAAQHYAVDPLGKEAAALSAEDKKRILGGEACMWAEFVDPGTVDSRIWPRLGAIAERLWSPANVTDVDSMYARMETLSRSLDFRGLTHHTGQQKLLEGLAGGGAVEPVRTLVDVVEPVKGYARTRAQPKPTQQTPLNRLVDTAAPESMQARKFMALVNAMDRAQLREWLTRWRDNDAALRPVMSGSSLLGEAGPVSEQLKRVAEAGLAAVDALNGGAPPAADWAAKQHAILDEAAKPRAEVTIAIVPAVAKLVDAAAKQPH